MLDTLPLTELGLAAAALALGGVLKGATGAGAPILAVPVMAVFFGVEIAVVTFAVPGLLLNIWQGWQYRAHQAAPRFTWVFAGAGGAGAAAGSWILARLPANLLLLAVAGVVFAYVGFRLSRPHWVLSEARANRLVGWAGLLGGMLQGATGVSAPVSVTFLNAMGLARPVFIATISVFFAAMAAAQIPALCWLGLMDGPRLLWGMAAMLPLLAGMPLGAWLAARLSRATFDRIILGLLAVIALRLIWQALA